jgi:phospholipid transport system substrate-binding protein
VARDVLTSLTAMGKSLAALLLVAATAASTASPREVVQRAVTRVVELLDGSGSASPGERGGVISAIASVRRRAQIRAVADELFDFEEVSRRALSVHWAARTPQERTEFVGLFTDLLERNYLGKVEGYAGEKIVYPAEKIDGDFAIVRSRIVPRSRKDVRARETGLEYRMLRRDGRWKVYDVIIDGVSFVSTYRSQFDRIIKASSYATLVDRLRGPEARVGPTERP